MVMKQAKANFVLLAVAVIWGGGFVAGKMALTGADPFVILAWRFLASAVICGAVFRKRIAAAPKKVIRYGGCIGVLQVLALSVQLMGLEYTTSAKQSFLCTAYVAMTPFVSWLIVKKKPGWNAMLGGVLALAGIGLISLNGISGLNFGDGLSVGFAVLFALQVVLVGKFVDRDTDSIQLTFFQFLAAGVLSLVICIVKGEYLWIQGGEAWMGIAYLAVLNTCLAFILQNWAQKHTSDVVASLIISLESVFGFLFSVLYYQEPLSWRLLLGGALCFGAILLNTVKGK